MNSLIEIVSNMEYPGRLIVLGQNYLGHDLVLYAVTGRSPSSQARRLVQSADAVQVRATDPSLVAKGNPLLLEYDCIVRVADDLVVSNGAQTKVVAAGLKTRPTKGAVAVLADVLSEPAVENNIDLTSYEPDQPNYTPRITGLARRGGLALSIVRRFGEKAVRSFFEVPRMPGFGKLILTYAGYNVPKGECIPSFQGEPVEVALPTGSLEMAALVFEALGPKERREYIVSPGEDFRVGVAVVAYDRASNSASFHTINRHAA